MLSKSKTRAKRGPFGRHATAETETGVFFVWLEINTLERIDVYLQSSDCGKKKQSPANGKNLAKCVFDRFCTFGRVRISLKKRTKKAPQVGLEPTTLRLTAGCSAIELLRSNGMDGAVRRRDRTNLAERETWGQWLFP